MTFLSKQQYEVTAEGRTAAGMHNKRIVVTSENRQLAETTAYRLLPRNYKIIAIERIVAA